MREEFESGVVLESRDSVARVQLSSSEACQSCSARLFCRPDTNGNRVAIATNPKNAKPGQKVKLMETGYALLKMSLIQYGVPLVGLLAGIFFLYFLNWNPLPIAFEITMTLGGAIGVLLGGILSWYIMKIYSRRLSSVFEIVEVMS